jgi:hypothetical protein
MFPYHGHPLSWYEFAELMYTENHDIAVATTKKADVELKQAMSAATREYDKKLELEKGEREKSMNISDITTKLPACGVLGQLGASLVVKLADYINVSADLSALTI